MNGRAQRRQFFTDARDPFVIAEIGVNHDGDLDRALELVDAAVAADADAVKIQWFEAADLLSTTANLVEYQRDTGETDVREMLRRLELSSDALASVLERVHSCGLLAIATVFTPEHVPQAAELPWDLFKTASPDLINRPLIEALIATERPLIVSTGGASMAEVSAMLDWAESASIAVLHCVSRYPTPVECAALSGIGVLADSFEVPVGYSDHTTALETGALAVCCGATILEKHLTWSCTAQGPDHASSIEPDAFARYVSLARTARSMLGEPAKEPLDLEIEIISASRQSIAARHDLHAGMLLEKSDLTTMRPGTGMPPTQIAELLGRRLVRDVQRGGFLALQDVLPSEDKS